MKKNVKIYSKTKKTSSLPVPDEPDGEKIFIKKKKKEIELEKKLKKET